MDWRKKKARTTGIKAVGIDTPSTAGLCIAALGLAMAQSAMAVQMTDSTGSLTFDSPSTSLFGSSGSAAFGGSGYLLGDSSTGIYYKASASTGTMSSSVSGSLQSDFESEISLADAGSYSFDLDWLGGSSSFQSDLGAYIRISGELLGVINNFTIYEADYGLNIDESFISDTPKTVTGSDDFTPASVSVSLPTGGVGLSGTAGVDLDIQQDATFKIASVQGTVVATHQASSTTVSQAFTIDMTGAELIAGLDLGLEGLWDITFEDVALSATYDSVFSMETNPFIGGGWGVYCGDPFDPDDNFGCISEGGVKADNTLSTTLFDSPSLKLGYNKYESLEGFSVNVVAADVLPPPRSVPAPATLAILATGLVGLGVSRRRRPRR